MLYYFVLFYIHIYIYIYLLDIVFGYFLVVVWGVEQLKTDMERPV